MMTDFSPGSPWQTEAELNGASHAASADGTPIPYADLMKRASLQMAELRRQLAECEAANGRWNDSYCKVHNDSIDLRERVEALTTALREVETYSNDPAVIRIARAALAGKE